MSEMTPTRNLTIGMVAGEASGDNLGAPLVREILKLQPSTKFIGVGGPAMIAEGFVSEEDIERLSVNGFIDPLKRLPELIKLLFRIRDKIIASNVNCFVGIDFNFFNLLLEGMLRRKGVTTIHYVSPTVWAWRRRRLNKIARNVDLMMVLYPFETEIYQQNNIGVAYVGHPKANEIAPDEGLLKKNEAREYFGYGLTEKIVAILPGSRAREVSYSGRDFLETAALITGDVDRFVIPAANSRRKVQLEKLAEEYAGKLGSKLYIVEGDARRVITSADVVMVNSGTATLEALLLKRPMVMSYRLGRFTYAIISRLVTTRWFALPNILSSKTLVPEFIQDAADPTRMAAAVRELLGGADNDELLRQFDEIHRSLRGSGEPGSEAAKAVLSMCENSGARD